MATMKEGRVVTSLIDRLAGDYLQKRDNRELAPEQVPIFPGNKDWVMQAFMLAIDDSNVSKLKPEDKLNSRISTASIKYTDSTIGGNIPINPPYQFTPYADVPDPGVLGQTNRWIEGIGEIPDSVGIEMMVKSDGSVGGLSYGQGNYYSEAIDDNSQIIHMRFGVPAYNSLLQFFTGFYNSGLATAARAGRFTEGFHNILTTIGNVIGLAIAPLFVIPMAILFVGRFAQFAMGVPSTTFSYLSPKMPMYWTAVSSLVNQFATNLGLTASVNTRQAQQVLAEGNGLSNSDTPLETIVSQFVLDEWLDANGTIDVRLLASRSKRLQMKFNVELDRLFNDIQAGTEESANQTYESLIMQAYSNTRNGFSRYSDGVMNPEDYLEKWRQVWSGEADPKDGQTEEDLRNTPTIERDAEGNPVGRTPGPIKKWVSKMLDFTNAEVADGSDWVSFRVDNTGSVNSSFSNSSSPSALAAKINGVSSSMRDLRVNLADGNIIPGMEDIKNAAMAVVSGAAEILHVDGLAALGGSAFVDIPENWDSSTASLPRSDYTITLGGPYGNPVSQLFDIYIPLACLMAGALPLATGAQSHTHPFFCQLHDKGRNFIRYGMIDRLSITAGTSTLGFNKAGRPMAIEVSFSVKDLSTIMAVPIIQNGFSILSPLEGLIDDQSRLSDYVMTMTGISLPDMIYPFSLLRYRMAKKLKDIDTYFSPSGIASKLANLPGMGIVNAIYMGTNR